MGGKEKDRKKGSQDEESEEKGGAGYGSGTWHLPGQAGKGDTMGGGNWIAAAEQRKGGRWQGLRVVKVESRRQVSGGKRPLGKTPSPETVGPGPAAGASPSAAEATRLLPGLAGKGKGKREKGKGALLLASRVAPELSWWAGTLYRLKPPSIGV